MNDRLDEQKPTFQDCHIYENNVRMLDQTLRQILQRYGTASSLANIPLICPEF